ncbi:MAG TPA: KpsF/GutQ family sugar-phosphate isomerase [Gemmatimonadota bacterium]|nr:KpsF/GutQ family sugar-phosphate isomerase [Gemmatimonadota bacterium]
MADPGATAWLARARETLRLEAGAIAALETRLGPSFAQAVEFLFACRGRAIVTGMGKSGLVGRKIAATLTSTGTPSVFVHPAEGVHGDAGIALRGDVVLAISKSGETRELLELLGVLKRFDLPLIALVGRPDSTLARHADATLDCSVDQEACPHDLTPTASTAAMLAFGDALAMALLTRRDFRPEEFALFHPGGALGKRLLLTVADVMVSGEGCPSVPMEATMREAILEMAHKRGTVPVVDGGRRVVGVVTNGDLMRLMEATDDVFRIPVAEVMTRDPKVTRGESLAATAVNQMENHGIVAMPVVDGAGRLQGIVHLHDCMRAGVV